MQTQSSFGSHFLPSIRRQASAEAGVPCHTTNSSSNCNRIFGQNLAILAFQDHHSYYSHSFSGTPSAATLTTSNSLTAPSPFVTSCPSSILDMNSGLHSVSFDHSMLCGNRGSPSSLSPSDSGSIPVNVTMKEPGIPYIMTRLCNFIESSGGMTQEGIFRISGNVKTMEKLKNHFDTTGDAPLETMADVASAAGLIKSFLRELPDPVIPHSLHSDFFQTLKGKMLVCI